MENNNKKSSDQFESFIASIKNTNTNKQIKLPTLTGFKIVNLEDILYLESDSNYTHVNYKNGNRELVSKTLKEFEKNLPKELFCRIHNSHIVSLSSVKEYIKGRGGQIVLTNNTVLTVSQNKKNDFLEYWI
jgi:two-component system LytT family response regulator